MVADRDEAMSDKNVQVSVKFDNGSGVSMLLREGLSAEQPHRIMVVPPGGGDPFPLGVVVSVRWTDG